MNRAVFLEIFVAVNLCFLSACSYEQFKEDIKADFGKVKEGFLKVEDKIVDWFRGNHSESSPRKLLASSIDAPGINQCNGNKVGTYTWGQDLWKPPNDTDLLSWFSSPIGRQWACGDLYINVADYTNPAAIKGAQFIIPFIKKYRQSSGATQTVVWLTYGDTSYGNGTAMVQFVDTFYAWARNVSVSDIALIGRVGLSYDVEHIDASYTKQALLKAQALKSTTRFPRGQLLVQHTIEGNPNTAESDYVMKYADSALMMVYRNYLHDPTGKYQDDSSILARMQWFLTKQCVNCLNDAYATSNYKAVITVLVESSCTVGEYCGKLSFCAFDGANQGAYYVWNTVANMFGQLLSTNSVTRAQYKRLFNQATPYAVQDWNWYRCFAPFSQSLQFSNCKGYHAAAAICRVS